MTMGALMTHTKYQRTPPMAIVDLATHPEPWLRVRQCAEYLQVSETFLWTCIAQGTLKVKRYSARVVRISIENFRTFEATEYRRPGH